MSSIICGPEFVSKVVAMKKDGKAANIKNLIVLDNKPT